MFQIQNTQLPSLCHLEISKQLWLGLFVYKRSNKHFFSFLKTHILTCKTSPNSNNLRHMIVCILRMSFETQFNSTRYQNLMSSKYAYLGIYKPLTRVPVFHKFAATSQPPSNFRQSKLPAKQLSIPDCQRRGGGLKIVYA